jgi:signal transduction histidine kinase
VTQFLNFAKPAQLLLAPIDAGMLAERAAEEIAPEAGARGGSVTVRGRFGQVDGDEVLLRQALSNVCRNALEACLNAHVVPQIAIDGAPEPAQGMLRISVIDNGPGISDSMATRIFQPFVTTKPNGIGLGLALVQKIVVTHNGRVTAQREPAGGTRIVITLPLRDAAVI